MALRQFILAGVAAFAASTAARADSITYNDFSSVAGLTTAGTAAQEGDELALTNGTSSTAGAAYSSNAFALGTNGSFTSTFEFQITTNQNSTNNANGFAFVLSTAPGTNGQSNGNFGIGTNPGTSVAIEFSTYGNPNLSPLYYTTAQGKPIYNSNFVGVINDGDTNVASHAANTWGTVYGAGTGASVPLAGECDSRSPATSFTRFGCMANGDTWQATVTLTAAKLLTVSLVDISNNNGARIPGAATTPITLTYDIAGYLGTNDVYAGFTSSTGGSYEQVNLLNWVMTSDGVPPVPEPATFALLAAGLGAIGLVRTRRSA
jgi:hypothetical protein